MPDKFKICTVIKSPDLSTFLKKIEEIQPSAQFIELRADYLSDFEERDLIALSSKTKIDSIFTFRSVNEGGKFKGSVQQQKSILMAAFEANFTFVDIDYKNPVLSKLTATQKKKLIVSYHNFNSTPSTKELTSIIEKIRKISPEIIKIATKINAVEDIFNLLEILKNKKEKIIVIGMGQLGKASRILFPILGSYLTYTSDDEAIAPGIMTREELNSVFNIINY